jgi:hypothetical protein
MAQTSSGFSVFLSQQVGLSLCRARKKTRFVGQEARVLAKSFLRRTTEQSCWKRALLFFQGLNTSAWWFPKLSIADLT